MSCRYFVAVGDPQAADARYMRCLPDDIQVSNTWRPVTPFTVGHVTYQVGISFPSRIFGNAFFESMPDLLFATKFSRPVENT